MHIAASMATNDYHILLASTWYQLLESRMREVFVDIQHKEITIA